MNANSVINNHSSIEELEAAFVNYAVWESTAHLKKALNNIDLEAILSDYPPSTVVSPHLFKKVAVPGICID
jgi:hypothetical protein